MTATRQTSETTFHNESVISKILESQYHSNAPGKTRKKIIRPVSGDKEESVLSTVPGTRLSSNKGSYEHQ